ncbi:unnamed protein product, partial [Closterium sp. NIES-53]
CELSAAGDAVGRDGLVTEDPLLDLGDPDIVVEQWYAGRQRGGGAGPCTYVLRTGDRAGEQCGGLHSTQRCFGRLTDSWRHQFPDATEIPRWGDLSRAGFAVFDLDYDAILAAMYALSTSDEGDCYLCVLPDPGIEAAALGAGEAAALGAGEAAALGASASAAPGAGESALSGTASAQVLHTFTLDSGASRSFFRDRTTLTPLSRPVAVSLADPSGGPDLASFSTVLPCPAAPSGTLLEGMLGFDLFCMGDSSLSGASTVDGGGGVAHGNVVCQYRSFVGGAGRDGASMDASWGTDCGGAITGSVTASGRDSECMETGVQLELGCEGRRLASSSSSGPLAVASMAAIESAEHWFCEVEEREPETRVSALVSGKAIDVKRERQGIAE